MQRRIKAGEKEFEERGFFFADPEFLEVFSWKMIHGDPETALKDPYSVILTTSVARKYFGDEDVVGSRVW